MTEPLQINSERGSIGARQVSVGHTLLEVSRAVSLPKSGTVLDLFTGDGASLAAIQKITYPRRIICAERSKIPVNAGLAGKRFNNVRPEDLHIEHAEDLVREMTQSGDKVDLITGFGISDEYVDQPGSFLADMQSIVRRNGVILMTGPEGYVESMFAQWQHNYGGEFVVRADALHDWDTNMYLWVNS